MLARSTTTTRQDSPAVDLRSEGRCRYRLITVVLFIDRLEMCKKERRSNVYKTHHWNVYWIAHAWSVGGFDWRINPVGGRS